MELNKDYIEIALARIKKQLEQKKLLEIDDVSKSKQKYGGGKK